MVYQRSYVPGVPPALVPTPPPPAAETPEVTRGVAPLLYDPGVGFMVGQPSFGGGYHYDADQLIAVDAMTKAQLDAAAIELNRDVKREFIQKQQFDLMLRLANASSTKEECLTRFWEEPFLNMEETPPFDHWLSPTITALSEIVTDLTADLVEINQDLATKETLRLQIITLGGQSIPVPVPPGQVEYEMDKIKETLGAMAERLVPTPGPEPATEPLPETWPEVIPEFPNEVPAPGGATLEAAWQQINYIQEYQVAARKHSIAVLFNMSWCLEMIRVCLNELKAAKAPGTQTEQFLNNLSGLGDGTFTLETSGIFHD